MKKIYIAIFLFLSVFDTIQAQLPEDLLGSWVYSNSLDSVNGIWITYLEIDAYHLNKMSDSNANLSDVEASIESTTNIHSPENYFDLPLLLKDTTYEIKFSSLKQDGFLRLNVFEYPKDGSSFVYSRAQGFLRVEVIETSGKNTVLRFFNEDRFEEYIILESSKIELLLLDEKSNKKHLFKRKL